MESKIHSIIITLILAFALISGISAAAFVSVLAQGDSGMTGGASGDTSGRTSSGSTGQ
jgi:hypothetical protein